MTDENTFKAKQKRIGKKVACKEVKVGITSEYRRTIKKTRMKAKVEKKHEKVRAPTPTKPSIPRPLIIRSDLEFTSRKLEPKVISPASIKLSDKQRAILYILHNMFRNKKIKDALSIISNALGINVENILGEILALENLKLIRLSNGVIGFTCKGEIIVNSITLDKNIVNRVREFNIKVPKVPFIHVGNITKKTLDKHNYLFHVGVHKKELVVPRIPMLHVNVSVSPLNINKGTIVIEKYKVRVIAVPQIPQIFSTEINMRNLDKAINTTLISKTPKKVSVKVIEKTKRAARFREVRLPSSLLTMLFKKRYGAKGLLSIKPERPVIIIAIKTPNDNYIATLLSILREIYRMKVGGLPIGRYVGTKATIYIAEEELIRQGLIKVIDDSKADFLEFFNISKIEEFNKIDLNKLSDRLTEISVQGFSFLVFYVNENKAKQLLTYLTLLRDKIAPAKVIVLSPHELTVEQKRELARITWGFVDPNEPLLNNTLDQHFKRREEEFNNVLERISTKRKYVKIVRESVEDEEGLEGTESALHYQLKVFIVYYLIRKLKVAEEDIETEAELPADDKKIIPDIRVRSKNLAIEVETFYGTGLTPWRKLRRTIEKYLENRVVNEVWIVIPPLQTMLYLKGLVDEVKELREKGYNFIKLYTVDLSKMRLVPLKKIPAKLSKLFAKITKL